ncbi:hypothetical protein F5B21DRAFT_365759 [Xylaria acuta]|nr:hypothetical protein F5B21DRAFT_365759 [Xylaria acuta]
MTSGQWGVVILELVIWLLYGIEELERLHGELDLERAREGAFFVLRLDFQAELHPMVIRWFSQMCMDSVCTHSTVLGDLLRLVQQRLLVVKLPNKSEAHGRAIAPVLLSLELRDLEALEACERSTALEFRDGMDQILLKTETVTAYLPNGAAPKLRRGPPPRSPKILKLLSPATLLDPKTVSFQSTSI